MGKFKKKLQKWIHPTFKDHFNMKKNHTPKDDFNMKKILLPKTISLIQFFVFFLNYDS